MSTYADVILPLPLENQYTYRIPADLEPLVVRGSRVIVHFGKKRFYTAIVVDVHDRQPQTDYEVKEIFSILDADIVCFQVGLLLYCVVRKAVWE